MAYLLIWVAMLAVTEIISLTVPEIISRHLGWLGIVVFYLLVASVAAAITTHQIHRRGQTVAEAMTASRAGRRNRAEQELRRRNARQERSRHEAALPWLNDRQLSPGELPGVTITPATGTQRDHFVGHDVVLDFPGDKQIQVIVQLRRLTGLSFEEAKNLLDTAPVPVLRVPDMPMAQAAKYVLESAGATVSITDTAN
jgi:hypothetical protein